MAQRDGPARELVRMAERLAKGAAGDHAGRLALVVDERDLVVVVLPVLVRRMAVVTRVRVRRIGHDHWPAPIEEQVAGVPSHVVPPDRILEGEVHLAMTGPRVLEYVTLRSVYLRR